MNHDEQTLIRGLFSRLADVERSAPPRDAGAESFIREQVSAQPGAPYYMAQTIVMQDQALAAAEARIRELEETSREAPATSGRGGLLGGLWGGGSRSPSPRSAVPSYGSRGQPARGGMQQPSMGGGGFLAGAAQTAMGVAGGMLLGNMLAGMFTGDEATAAETPPADDTAGAEDASAEADADAGGFDFGDEI